MTKKKLHHVSVYPKPQEFLTSKSYSKKLEEIGHPEGEVSVKLDGPSRKLAREAGSMVFECFYRMANIDETVTEINFHLESLKELYRKMSTESQVIGHKIERAAKHAEFEPLKGLGSIYKAVGDLFKEQAQQVKKQKKIFNSEIKMMFDFSFKEFEGLEEVEILPYIAYYEKK